MGLNFPTEDPLPDWVASGSETLPPEHAEGAPHEKPRPLQVGVFSFRGFLGVLSSSQEVTPLLPLLRLRQHREQPVEFVGRHCVVEAPREALRIDPEILWQVHEQKGMNLRQPQP